MMQIVCWIIFLICVFVIVLFYNDSHPVSAVQQIALATMSLFQIVCAYCIASALSQLAQLMEEQGIGERKDEENKKPPRKKLTRRK